MVPCSSCSLATTSPTPMSKLLFRSRCEITFLDPDGEVQHGLWLTTTPHEKGIQHARAMSLGLQGHFRQMGCEVLSIQLVTTFEQEIQLERGRKVPLRLVQAEPRLS